MVAQLPLRCFPSPGTEEAKAAVVAEAKARVASKRWGPSRRHSVIIWITSAIWGEEEEEEGGRGGGYPHSLAALISTSLPHSLAGCGRGTYLFQTHNISPQRNKNKSKHLKSEKDRRNRRKEEKTEMQQRVWGGGAENAENEEVRSPVFLLHKEQTKQPQRQLVAIERGKLFLHFFLFQSDIQIEPNHKHFLFFFFFFFLGG